jgi:hypothetical protein
MICKKRLHENLRNPFAPPRADVSLLLLCMKLITWYPSENSNVKDPQTSAYFMAKRFLLEVETAGILSLQVLQGNILLAMYEIGHAIYPAAYITVGMCTRLATALGIHGKVVLHVTETSVWMEQEERRRVWWVVMILDR